MARWFFEPGHTAAEFAVRHMMVTEVRGHFKNVKGTLDFDDRDPVRGTAEAIIDARGISTRSATPTCAARTSSTSSATPRSATRGA